MSKKIYYSFHALVVVLLIATIVTIYAYRATPGAQAPSDLLASLPESDLVILVDVQRLLNEAIPRILTNDEATLVQMNAAINELKAYTDIDVRAINRAVIGMRGLKAAADMKKPEFAGVMIVEGLNPEVLLALLRREGKGKYREQQYEGKTLYISVADGGLKPPGPMAAGVTELALTALDTNTIALGTPAEVRASIDASAGRAPRVSADLVALATRNTDVLIGIAGTVPPSMMTPPPTGSGEKQSDEFSRALSSLRQVYASIGLTPAGFDIFAVGRAGGPAEAKTLSDMLNAFRTLGSLGSSAQRSEQEKLIRDLLASVQISAEGDEVQIKYELTQSTLNALVQLGKQMGRRQVAPPAPKAKQPRRGPRRRARRIPRG